MALLTFNNLTYNLGNHDRKIKLSGTLDEGNILVVRGPSGAGKSTLLRILAKLQPCLEGEVLLNNCDWHQLASNVWRTQVHYLAQRPAIFVGTVLENLAKPFQISLLKNKLSFDLTEATKLLQQLLLSPDLLQQDAKTLSGGEAARIALIRSLLTRPNVLLLDEPTAALDAAAREAFYATLSKWLEQPKRGAILVSHYDDFSLPNTKYLDIVSK